MNGTATLTPEAALFRGAGFIGALRPRRRPRAKEKLAKEMEVLWLSIPLRTFTPTFGCVPGERRAFFAFPGFDPLFFKEGSSAAEVDVNM